MREEDVVPFKKDCYNVDSKVFNYRQIVAFLISLISHLGAFTTAFILLHYEPPSKREAVRVKVVSSAPVKPPPGIPDVPKRPKKPKKTPKKIVKKVPVKKKPVPRVEKRVVRKSEAKEATPDRWENEEEGPSWGVPQGQGEAIEGGELIDYSRRAERLSLVKPKYTEAAIDEGLEGTFTADVFIDATGKVTEVELQEEVGFEMDERLREACFGAKYSPRLNTQGIAISGWDTIVFDLTLP